MGQRIDQFSEDLREKLTNIDNGLHDVKQGIDQRNSNAAQHVRDHLATVHKRIADRHQHVVNANTRVKNWADSKRAETGAEVAAWKAGREIAKLEKRAEKAEDYAAAASEVALAAVDEAEAAALEAWLARVDADVAAS